LYVFLKSTLVILGYTQFTIFYVQQTYASTTASSSSSSISYNLLARVIPISCSSTDLTDIHEKLDHDGILSKQSG